MPREQLFCAHFLGNDYQAQQAALSAGYAKASAHVTATNLLKKPRIQQYIYMMTEEKINELGITTEWKMRMLKECVLRSMPGDKDVNSSGVIGAIAEMNKMVGDYAPAKSINTHLVGEDSEEIKKIMAKHEREY